MILQKLPAPGALRQTSGVPSFSDHCLFVKSSAATFQYPQHFTGLGIIALLKGRGSFTINHSRTLIDQNSFLIANRGSTLSFKLEASTQLCILYFNTLLSDILSIDLFNKETLASSSEEVADFSLLEHLHYQNASLKSHLALLMDLASSCASFHALKADMLIRSMLDDLLAENYHAVCTSANLPVVKQVTRVDLFKRLQLARKWLEQNYASPVSLRHAADIAMLNREHFLRMFKLAYQQTPHQFLTHLRIERAKLLLTKTSEPISSICQQVGFGSLSTFSGLFKQKTGGTPGEFRREAK